jgi:hypothetical protein
MHKKSRVAAGCLNCLIFYRERVRHRTGVKLSFARVLGRNYRQLPASQRRRESPPAAEIVC